MAQITKAGSMQNAGVPFAWVEVQYPDEAQWDADGIIFSMIAGADARTCAREESRHVFYPVFGVPGQAPDALQTAQARLAEYAALLSKDAQIACELI